MQTKRSNRDQSIVFEWDLFTKAERDETEMRESLHHYQDRPVENIKKNSPVEKCKSHNNIWLVSYITPKS